MEERPAPADSGDSLGLRIHLKNEERKYLRGQQQPTHKDEKHKHRQKQAQTQRHKQAQAAVPAAAAAVATASTAAAAAAPEPLATEQVLVLRTVHV